MIKAIALMGVAAVTYGGLMLLLFYVFIYKPTKDVKKQAKVKRLPDGPLCINYRGELDEHEKAIS
jgi:hypothetical protein